MIIKPQSLFGENLLGNVTKEIIDISKKLVLFNPETDDLVMQSAAFQKGKIKSELVTVDGSDRVATFFDYNSGLNNDSTQSTDDNKGIFTLNSLNGRPSIILDGDNDSFMGASGLNGICLANHTIFFVVRLGIPDETTQCFLSWNKDSGGGNSEIICFRDTGFLIIAGDIGADDVIAEDLRSTNMIVSMAFDHANTLITRLNGVEKTNKIISNVTSCDAFTIGAELDTGSTPGNFLGARIGEILLYDALLGLPKIINVEGYLSDKWGLPLG